MLIFGPLVGWFGLYLEEQRERALAAQVVSEERERAREISTKDARIVAQREAFKERVAEGTLHKAILGDPYTVRHIGARARAEGQAWAAAESGRAAGVTPPVNTVRAMSSGSGGGGGGGGGGVNMFGGGFQAAGPLAPRREAAAIAEALAAMDRFDARPLPKMPKNAIMQFRMT